MNTHPQGGLHLIVLIPHRDSRAPLRQWSAQLFAAGLHGAWSFPWAAPLGIISRLLTKDELNDLAHALREQSLADGRDGKMQTGAATALPFPKLAAENSAGTSAVGSSTYANLSFLGPALDIRFPEPLLTGSAAAALVYAFPFPVLASAIVRDVPQGLPPYLPPPPAISFRAAAVANMIYRPLPADGGANSIDGESYSFEWQIGELCWLPSVKNKKRGE